MDTLPGLSTRILPLDQSTDAAHCGHKAAALAALRRAGCHVPDGFVIPVDAQPSESEIDAAMKSLGAGRWAVRSSGVAEDLDEASFAGQYETVLGAGTTAEVVAAAQRVRASAFSRNLAAYQRAQSGAAGPAGGVAVLVQRLVDATAAGVAFSANPVTGDDETVIEAVRGLGDRLVSGERDGDRWIVNVHARAGNDTGVIERATALRIAELAKRVAGLRGAPQDIEWAIAGSELFLLQARPITGLPRRPKWEIPPGRWTKDVTHWSGPMTPMGASILLPELSAATAKVFQEFGLPLERFRPLSLGGEVYMQEIEVGGKHNPGSPPPWWLGAIVFRVIPVLRRLAQTAEEALPKLESYPRKWEDTWRAQCAGRIELARKVDLAALTDAQLQAHLRHLIDDVLAPAVLIHFQLMLPDMVALHDLARCCRETLGWNDAQMLELLAGVSTTALRAAEELADVADAAGPTAVREGIDAVRRSLAGPRLQAWLDLWGLRALDCDPGSPTIAEAPALVAGLLRHPRPDRGAVERKRQAAIAKARAALAGENLARFNAALAVAERLHPQREENVLYTQSLPMGLIRRVLVELGRRLVATGALRTADDVVYLELGELHDAFAGTMPGESAAERTRRRRAERTWVRAHPGPAYHGPAPVPPPSPRGLPHGLNRLLSALSWEVALEETAPTPASGDDVLTGTPASPGRATGRVRVVRSEADLAAFEPGEILVCPSTHSSWAVVFAKAAAVVTDHGGLLSHPSIVAREFGLPAVVGTGRATARLTTGQSVTVNGTTGRVELKPV